MSIQQPRVVFLPDCPIGEIHCLHIEDSAGEVRQYGYHYGTDRKMALQLGEERAEWFIKQGCRSVALKMGTGQIVRIWDWRDFE